MRVEVPIKLPSPNAVKFTSLRGARAHWARTSKVRSDVGWALRSLGARPNLPVVCRLTRLSKGRLDAHDNLRASLKPVADEVTFWLGLASDADPRVTWEYAQGAGFGARIEFFRPCKVCQRPIGFDRVFCSSGCQSDRRRESARRHSPVLRRGSVRQRIDTVLETARVLELPAIKLASVVARATGRRGWSSVWRIVHEYERDGKVILRPDAPRRLMVVVPKGGGLCVGG